eukprot:scaffold132491_cov31-Tisochrysis_lutea.AAC.4
MSGHLSPLDKARGAQRGLRRRGIGRGRVGSVDEAAHVGRARLHTARKSDCFSVCLGSTEVWWHSEEVEAIMTAVPPLEERQYDETSRDPALFLFCIICPSPPTTRSARRKRVDRRGGKWYVQLKRGRRGWEEPGDGRQEEGVRRSRSREGERERGREGERERGRERGREGEGKGERERGGEGERRGTKRDSSRRTRRNQVRTLCGPPCGAPNDPPSLPAHAPHSPREQPRWTAADLPALSLFSLLSLSRSLARSPPPLSSSHPRPFIQYFSPSLLLLLFCCASSAPSSSSLAHSLISPSLLPSPPPVSFNSLLSFDFPLYTPDTSCAASLLLPFFSPAFSSFPLSSPLLNNSSARSR